MQNTFAFLLFALGRTEAVPPMAGLPGDPAEGIRAIRQRGHPAEPGGRADPSVARGTPTSYS
jgi:hypothetical protein